MFVLCAAASQLPESPSPKSAPVASVPVERDPDGGVQRDILDRLNRLSAIDGYTYY